MTIQRFEDIEAWQGARQLTQMVYGACRQGRFARDLRLTSQIQSAAASVMSNIAEGFDAGSDAEFIRFLCYARRSATEVQSELYVALDANYVDAKVFQSICDKATEVKRLINGFIRYLRSSRRDKAVLRESQEAAYLINDSALPDHPTNDHSTT